MSKELNNGNFSGSARVLSGSEGSVLYNFEAEIDGGFDDSLGYSVSGPAFLASCGN